MASPLIAQSSDGSLIAVHHPPTPSSSSQTPSSHSSSNLVRCYDGQVSNGSLKFTLRIPPSSSSSGDEDPIRKLTFANGGNGGNGGNSGNSGSGNSGNAPRFLCGMKSNSISIWDLDRGVISHTIDIRSAGSAGSPKKKRKSGNSLGGDSLEGSAAGSGVSGTLCDIATSNGTLYALILLPSDHDSNDARGGKCRVYQYDLNNNRETLVKKIKVGSVHGNVGGAGTTGGAGSAGANGTTFAIAISNNGKQMAVRISNTVRVCDVRSGKKLGVLELPIGSIGSAGSGTKISGGSSSSGEDFGTALLRYSKDEKFIVTSSAHGNGGNGGDIALLSLSQSDAKEGGEKGEGESLEVETVALLTPNDASSPVSYLDLTLVNDGEDNEDSKNNESTSVAVLAFQASAGIASLFSIPTTNKTRKTKGSSPLVPITPKAKLHTKQSKSGTHSTHGTGGIHGNFLTAGFHPRKPSQELILIFQGSGTSLSMEYLSHRSLKGASIVGDGSERGGGGGGGGGDMSKGAEGNKGNKRKSHNIAMAAGDQGAEATSATDLTLQDGTETKRKKRMREEGNADGEGGEGEKIEDEFDLEEEEDAEKEQSIAERLALLSSALEQSSEEEDDDEDDEEEDDLDGTKNKSFSLDQSKFDLKSATSESLTALLTQALTSNDTVQLNIALQVTDRRIVENTVRSLQALDAERFTRAENDGNNGNNTAPTANMPGYMAMLMGHIVRRMARRHTLVVSLGVWVKAILAATARNTLGMQGMGGMGGMGGEVEEQMAQEAREMALKLGPLKNFLNERVECFPELLRLEGRLALLSQQF